MKHLNLNGIATVIAKENQGYISQDLRTILILADKIGLGIAPYLDEIIAKKYKVTYGDERTPMSLEADIILALRFKCGDSTAMEQLLLVNKGIFVDCVSQLVLRGKKSWQEYESDVYTAYIECVRRSSLYVEDSNGVHCYKTTYKKNFTFYLKEVLGKEQMYFSSISYPLSFQKAYNFCKMRQEKEQITIQDLTVDMLMEWLNESKSYRRTIGSVKEIYDKLCEKNKEISLDALLAIEDSSSVEKHASKLLYHGGVLAANMVEDVVVDKLVEEKIKDLMIEIDRFALEDAEVGMFVTYMRYKDEITYRDVMRLYHVVGDGKDAKKLIMRGLRKLEKKYHKSEYTEDILEWLRRK